MTTNLQEIEKLVVLYRQQLIIEIFNEHKMICEFDTSNYRRFCVNGVVWFRFLGDWSGIELNDSMNSDEVRIASNKIVRSSNFSLDQCIHVVKELGPFYASKKTGQTTKHWSF